MFLNFLREKESDRDYITLMLMIFEKLEDKYPKVYQQIKEGLLISCRKMIQKPLPNYVNFNYNVNVLSRFEEKKFKGFAIKGIFIFDELSNRYLELNLHIDHGFLIGFWVPETKNFKFNSRKIDISKQYIQFFKNSDFEELKLIIGEKQAELINPSYVNKVCLDGTDYFTIKELEDGEFLIIDLDSKIYHVSYSPFNLTLVDKILVEALSSFK